MIGLMLKNSVWVNFYSYVITKLLNIFYKKNCYYFYEWTNIL